MDKPVFLSYINAVMLYMGDYFSIIIASFIFYLCIEYPLRKIIKILIIDWINTPVNAPGNNGVTNNSNGSNSNGESKSSSQNNSIIIRDNDERTGTHRIKNKKS